MRAIFLQFSWKPPFIKDSHPGLPPPTTFGIITGTFGPFLLMDSHCNFPFLILYLPTSWQSQEFPQSPGWLYQLLGCPAQAYKTCTYPTLRQSPESTARR